MDRWPRPGDRPSSQAVPSPTPMEPLGPAGDDAPYQRVNRSSDESSSGARVRSAAGPGGRRAAGARARAGAGPRGNRRSVPHRHPCRSRGVAGQAEAASDPRTRGRRSDRGGRPTEVAGLAVGDRVAVPWLGYACGQCRYCNDGRETLCARQLRTGYTIDGSYADNVLGYARHVVKVPDEVSSFDAAPLTCAGVTTYKAVKLSGARPTSLVAVVGVGSGTSGCSTPGSPAPRSSRSMSARNGSRPPRTSAPTTWCTPGSRTWPRRSRSSAGRTR